MPSTRTIFSFHSNCTHAAYFRDGTRTTIRYNILLSIYIRINEKNENNVYRKLPRDAYRQ